MVKMPRLNRRVFAVSLLVAVLFAACVFGLHRFQVAQQSGFFLARAKEAQELGNLPSAIGHYRKALQTDPKQIAALRGLSECLEDAGDIRSAYLAAQRAVSADASDQITNVRLARLSLVMRRYSDAIERFRKLLIDSPESEDTFEWLLFLGDAYVGNLDAKLAAQTYKKATSLRDAKPVGYQKLAELQSSRLQSPETAMETLDAMVERFATDPHAWIGRGEWYLGNSRGKSSASTVADEAKLEQSLIQAASDAGTAMDLDSESIDALDLATRVAVAQGKHDRVEELASLGMKAFPDESDFYLYASNSASMRAEAATDEADSTRLHSESRDILEAGMRHLPDEPKLIWTLVNQLLAEGQSKDAKPLIARLKQLNYIPAYIRYLEAKLLASEGANLDAARQLELVRADVVEVPEAVRLVDMALAEVYRDTGDLDRQIAVLRRVVNADEGWLPGRERLAIALLQGGRVDEAVEEYKNIAARPGLPIAAPLNFARLLILQNLNRAQSKQEWKPVEVLLENLSREESLLGDIAILRAEMYSAQGMTEDARSILDDACKTRPSDSLDRLWSARVLLEIAAGEGDLAADLITKATEAIGDTPTLRYARAMASIADGLSTDETKLTELVLPNDDWSGADTLLFQRQMIPLLLSTEQYELSKATIDEIIKVIPSDVSSRLQMLQLAYQSKDYQVMRRTLDDLQKLSGSSAVWHYGNALLIRGESTSSVNANASTVPVASAGTAKSKGMSDALNRKAQEHLAEAAVLRREWSNVPALSGQLYDLAGDEESAIIRYTQAIELGYRQPVLLRRLIGLLTSRERFGEADAMIRRLRSGNQPFSPEMARIASEISVQMADLRQALKLATQAAEESNAVDDWLWLANLSELNNDTGPAEDAYETALAVAPDSSAAQLAWIGFLDRHARLGEAKSALAAYSERTQPTDHDRQLVIAEGFWRIGEENAAKKQLKRVDVNRLVGVDQHQTAYKLMLTLGETSSAAQLTSVLIDRNGEIGDWARRASALQIVQQPQADTTFADAQNLVLRNLSKFFGKDDVSDDSFLFASLAPETFPDRRALAVILSVAGGKLGAKRPLGLFQQLLDDGWSADASDQFIVGQLYAYTGDWTRGRRLMLPLLGSADRTNLAPIRKYASLLIDRGDVSEAQLWLTQLRERGDTSLDTVRLVAESMFRLGQHPALIEALTAEPATGEQTIDLVPSWLTQSASTTDRFSLLAEFATRVQTNDSDKGIQTLYLDAERNMGGRLVGSKDFPGMLFAQQVLARGDCRQAMRAFENVAGDASEQELVAFAEVAISSENCGSDILSNLERIYARLAIDSDQSGVFNVIQARIKEARGDYNGAASIYEALLKKSPTDIVAMNNLATLLALSGDDPTRGITLCNEAITQRGKTFVLLDTRGVCKLKAGDLDGAKSDFDEAIGIYPHPIIQFHRAWLAREQNLNRDASNLFLLALGSGLNPRELHPLEIKTYKSMNQD